MADYNCRSSGCKSTLLQKNGVSGQFESSSGGNIHEEGLKTNHHKNGNSILKATTNPTRDKLAFQSSEREYCVSSCERSTKRHNIGHVKSGKLKFLGRLFGLGKDKRFTGGEPIVKTDTPEKYSVSEPREFICTKMTIPSREASGHCYDSRGIGKEDISQKPEETKTSKDISIKETVKPSENTIEPQERISEEVQVCETPTSVTLDKSSMSAESIKSMKSSELMEFNATAESISSDQASTSTPRRIKSIPFAELPPAESSKSIAQGLTFPPCPNLSFEDILSSSPKRLTLTLFTDDELDDIFKHSDVFLRKSNKIYKAQSLEVLGNTI